MSAAPLGLLLRETSLPRLRGSAGLPSEELSITSVEHDHRRVRPGSLFVCLRGQQVDGHDFAPQALESGAALVVGEEPLDIQPYLRVENSRTALALLSCAFYAHPSRSLRLIGVTGTNGKTSVTWMLEHVLSEAGYAAAVLGTLGSGTTDAREGGAPFRALGFTTPESNALQEELHRWVGHGVQAGAMEVSSHALSLRRTFGTRFAALVFTNLSRDHLDFHGTMEGYRKAKNLLFRREERGLDEPPCPAVVNADDPEVEGILEGSTDSVIRFGRREGSDVRLSGLSMSPEGIRMRIDWVARGNGPVSRLPGQVELVSPLLGEFQVENLLAAFATGLALGLPAASVAGGLQKLRRIPGRMDRVDSGQGFGVLVDYAHTPDALRRALASLRPFTPGRTIVVFGCGGDRDRTKRRPMGRAAAEGADLLVLTDDNPRGEDPAAIREEVRRGVEEVREPSGRPSGLVEEGDRERAIRLALSLAQEGDIVLIAGKGHEALQIRGQERLPFDDREVAERILREGGDRGTRVGGEG